MWPVILIDSNSNILYSISIKQPMIHADTNKGILHSRYFECTQSSKHT